MNLPVNNPGRARARKWVPGKAIACFLLFFFLACPAPATPESQNPSSGEDKIHITADRLVSDQNRQFAEFSGDVRATQGDTVIHSNRLKVFYKSGADPGGNSKTNDEMIRKIVATGDVDIAFENRTAYSQKAVYTTHNSEVVLSGPGTRIESENNFIDGEKIIWNRRTGEMTVIGGTDKRVEAVFESDSQLQNPPEDIPSKAPDDTE
ncbi:MAG: LptA/OstA family protein [Thermodesulfobacteriota bacterium]